MVKFDFDKPVASFSWYLQNGSADDKRGNRLHVGTGQKAQIYFDPESGEFIGKLKYVDDYIDLADGAKQHFGTIGLCRSTTIKSCWRPLKIISDAERAITGRQAT